MPNEVRTTRPSVPQRDRRAAALVLAVWLMAPSLAWAQAPAPGLGPPPQTGGQPLNPAPVVPSQNSFVDMAIVAGLFGAAIFAVCRSSRRG